MFSTQNEQQKKSVHTVKLGIHVPCKIESERKDPFKTAEKFSVLHI